jgi:hypothetical protein
LGRCPIFFLVARDLKNILSILLNERKSDELVRINNPIWSIMRTKVRIFNSWASF